jgi:iron complex outermembrane receptor protein
VFNGLKFGGGFRFVDKRIPYTLEDIELPAYTILDAMLSYTVKKATISVNLYNITNKKHILGAYSSWQLRPGNPRTLRIGLDYTF